MNKLPLFFSWSTDYIRINKSGKIKEKVKFNFKKLKFRSQISSLYFVPVDLFSKLSKVKTYTG